MHIYNTAIGAKQNDTTIGCETRIVRFVRCKMTSFLNLLGAGAETYIDDGMFCKDYFNLPKMHWDRIKEIHQIVSDHGISPKLLEADDTDMRLCWDIVVPFLSGSSDYPDSLHLTINATRDLIMQKVGLLHSLGYAHGDLHIGNIGVTESQDIVFFDFDTAYRIHADRDKKWLNDWMEAGFGEESYDDFIEYDWSTWKTDFLFTM